jgi:hypothetical protein
MGVPFECDLCSFRNVTGRDPVLGDHNDHFTLVTIRRVLLDVMWAREPDTVAGNWARAKLGCIFLFSGIYFLGPKNRS